MRPVTKVILVLCVVALAVGVIWFVATHKWTGAKPAVVAAKPAAKPAATPTEGERSGYNDPLSTYERWRQRLSGSSSPQPGQPDASRPRPAHDLRSSSENEGTVTARQSDVPVAGADPPGPTLRPSGVRGTVVTEAWTPRANSGNTYTVAAHDTLYGIAMKFYGDPRYASAIEAANPGINPKALKVGDRIIIPDREVPAKPAPSAAAAPTDSQAKVYVVQKNDTLIGIARRFYGDAAMYRKIYEANRDVLPSANATLRVGQPLRLPQR